MRTLEADTDRLCELNLCVQLKRNGIVIREYAPGGVKVLYRGEFDDTTTNVPTT